jgi:hypothetical protein
MTERTERLVAALEAEVTSLAESLRVSAGLAASAGDDEAEGKLLTAARMVEGVDRSQHESPETYAEAVKWTAGQVEIELADLRREGREGNGCSCGNRDGPEG